MSKPDYYKIFIKGILKENPVLILMIGLCPVLATSSTANDAFGMGLATMSVLVASSILISLIRQYVPAAIRIPIFIIIISSFVTAVDLMIHAFMIELYASLGIFIPLIVVNCIILGRAEAFASKNDLIPSILDALGMSIGFIIAITLLGGIREIIGNGTITFLETEMINISNTGFKPALIFIMPPGAFMVIGFLIAGVRWINSRKGK